MESDLKKSQETSPSPSDSILSPPNLEEFPSEMPVPEELLDPWQSCPQPEREAVRDSVSQPVYVARFSVDSDLEAVADQALETPADQSSVPHSSSLIYNLYSGGDKEAPKVEESPTSLSAGVGSAWSDHDTDSRRFSWSSSKDSMISEESLFYIQESQPSTVGAGLMNLGNTCFMNAVLQCFTHTVPLIQGLRSCNHPVACERDFEDFCVVCALHDHIQISLSSSGGLVSPMKFVNNLNHFSSSFLRYEQEDAHEFLQCFLDKFERCFLDSKTAENLVDRVFGGRLISKLQCCNCGHCSNTFEPLIDLSLEIESADSVPCALASFTKVEKIDDSESRFTCENCKEQVAVEKQLMVDRAPSVAVFHLKRFKADGSSVEKIDKHVDFPLELDLQSYSTSASSNKGELMYDLYGIIVHVGFSSTSGHYFSFIRSSPDTWHRLDDSKVTRVREEYVLSQRAYILFYAKRGTPWFSSSMESEKPHLDLDNGSTSPQSVLDSFENARLLSTDKIASVSPGGGDSFEEISCVNENMCTTTSLAENNCHHDMCTSTSLAENNCHQGVDKVSINENMCTTTSLAEKNRHQGVDKVSGDDIFHPLTPPRARSPDLFSFETPGPSYQIPRNHLKSADQPTRKRLLNKCPDDSETKEAVRYLTRSMPSSRGSKLMAAMFRPQSEVTSRKKKKFESPCNRAGPADAHNKSSHGSVVHPVVAASR